MSGIEKKVIVKKDFASRATGGCIALVIGSKLLNPANIIHSVNTWNIPQDYQAIACGVAALGGLAMTCLTYKMTSRGLASLDPNNVSIVEKPTKEDKIPRVSPR